MKDYIQLKDVTLENLQKTVIYLVNEMQIETAEIYKGEDISDFIVTFPKGISNELFIFFYCAFMAKDLTNSRDILGWFYANDDLTKSNAKGNDFGKFKSSQYSKRIMITPNGDEKGNMHQHGITETGIEIHFGMDGTYKTLSKADLKYIKPIYNLNDYIKIETIQKQEKSVVEAKGCFASLRSLFGL